MSEVKVAQLCPTLCDPIDYTVHGILQARILEWAAIPFSRGSSNPGIEPRSPALQAIVYCLSHQEAQFIVCITIKYLFFLLVVFCKKI